MITLTAEEHAALIAECKADIAELEIRMTKPFALRHPEHAAYLQSQLKRQQISLASLEADPAGYHSSNAHAVFRVWPTADGEINVPVYYAPPVAVMQPVKCPTFNDYVPHIAKELRSAFTNAIRAAGYEVKS